MRRKLFNVVDTYTIRGVGVGVLPGLVPIGSERFKIGDALTLKRPSGEEIPVLIAGLELLGGTAGIPVVLKGLTTDDVPLGSELWSIE